MAAHQRHFNGIRMANREKLVRIMRRLNGVIARIADSFGGITFIVLYNVITLVWVLLGIYAPWFPDPYPLNFYTMLVSWLAINMSSLLLYVGKRQQARERAEEEHKSKTLDALLALAQSDASTIPIIRQIANNQIVILEHLQREEDRCEYSARDCSP